MSNELISKTWQIAGLFGKVTPGILVWKSLHVTYITDEGIQFSVPLSQIKDVTWPFLRMGLGFDAVVNGKKFKFSFSRPNSSVPEIDIVPGTPFPSVVSAGQYYDPASPINNLREDKATTKKWKEILGKK